MFKNKSLTFLLILISFLLAIIFLGSCSNDEELDYKTILNRQKLVELKGKTVALLPIQYNDKGIIGQRSIDPSLLRSILDQQMVTVQAELGKLFNIIKFSNESGILGGSKLDPNNSEYMRVIIKTLNVDGCLIIVSSYDYTYVGGSGGGAASDYNIASDTYLIDKDGNIVWNFYGKASASPNNSELFAPDSLLEGLKWALFIPPSKRVHIAPFTRLILKYTEYLRWLMEADIQGISTRNYYTNYPEENKDRHVAIFPAFDSIHTPIIATPMK